MDDDAQCSCQRFSRESGVWLLVGHSAWIVSYGGLGWTIQVLSLKMRGHRPEHGVCRMDWDGTLREGTMPLGAIPSS